VQELSLLHCTLCTQVAPETVYPPKQVKQVKLAVHVAHGKAQLLTQVLEDS
jgi:hypothetical protein